MGTKLEHANIVVEDIERMIRFLQTAFPDFVVRWEWKTDDGRRAIHIGNEHTYLALNEATKEAAPKWVPYSGAPGTNHLGYEVDDADALQQRMTAAGYRDSTVPNKHPHRKRVYFYDEEGNDWEFVQYYSDNPAERNDYELDG